MNKNSPTFGDNELRTLREISDVIRVPVPPTFLRSSEIFLAELARWNKRTNLISAGDEHRIIERHLLDSLCLLSVEPDLSGKKLLDVGSGAGFPGVVLALWEPACLALLVESRSKKAAFLNAIRRRLALDNVRVVNSRAENLTKSKEIPWPVDLIVSRGIRDIFALTVPLRGLLAKGGAFVFYKGAGAEKSLRENNTGAELKHLGFKIETIKPAWQGLTTLLILRT